MSSNRRSESIALEENNQVELEELNREVEDRSDQRPNFDEDDLPCVMDKG